MGICNTNAQQESVSSVWCVAQLAWNVEINRTNYIDEILRRRRRKRRNEQVRAESKEKTRIQQTVIII